MSQPARKTQWLVWGGLGLVIATIGLLYFQSRLDAAVAPLPVVGEIGDFHLTNQNDDVVSMDKLEGKVWIADIIFTRCPGPCRKMTARLAGLQAQLPAEVRFISLTSDPANDTPPVLKKFAGEFKADPERWWFLTGDKQQLFDLAIKDFKFYVEDSKPTNNVAPAEGLITHSTWFALVDRKGQVRGWRDHTGTVQASFPYDDPEAQAKLVTCVRQLLREPPL
jgi:cytochrome oxidase Cu insertion factor (SCO1/SenC/PrrC family)